MKLFDYCCLLFVLFSQYGNFHPAGQGVMSRLIAGLFLQCDVRVFLLDYSRRQESGVPWILRLRMCVGVMGLISAARNMCRCD